MAAVKPFSATHSRSRQPAFGLERELEFAHSAALTAGKILLGYYSRRSLKVGSKGRDNPVTNADMEADRALRELLTAAFPDYGWLSEETADNPARLKKQRVWVVDPLDGTKEFINRIPEFCVAIALAEKGVPILGVTYNPVRREMFYAAKGLGCFLNARRVHISRKRTLKRAVVLASRSEIKRGEWDMFEGAVEVKATGSVAYKLALAAAGKGDATLTRSPKSEWDIASGAALVLMAGGRITDIDGRELRFNRKNVKVKGLVAANEFIHAELLRMAQANPVDPRLR